MKRVFKITVSIITVLLLIALMGVLFISRGLKSGMNLAINGANLTSHSDGIYIGKYNAGRWSNEVNVTINDHKIIKIDVVKDVTFSLPKVTEAIISQVIEKQNTNIDVISGSTVTSKAYLKSIENALNK